jgi:hypothetical protein
MVATALMPARQGTPAAAGPRHLASAEWRSIILLASIRRIFFKVLARS